MEVVYEALDTLVSQIHQANVDAGWWTDLDTGERKERNTGEVFMLMVTEISEAMEGHRKDLMDDHLPQHKMKHVEIIDSMIRMCDYLGSEGVSTGAIMRDKLNYNAKREDHKIENRLKENGKKC